MAHQPQAESQYLCFSITQIQREELLFNESTKLITMYICIYIKGLMLYCQS